MFACLCQVRLQVRRTTTSRHTRLFTAQSRSPLALIFDTETTGLTNFKEDYTHDSQPSLVQLGMILVDTSNWIPKLQTSMLIQEVTYIEPKAEETHGISVSDCQRCGVPQQVALQLFAHALQQADYVVAHNYKFDQLVMAAALHRNNYTVNWDAFQHVCTMNEMTDILQLPSRNGYSNGYKWPSLEEAYQHVTGSPMEGAHDALVDAQACLAVLRNLVETKAVVLPEREADKGGRIVKSLASQPPNSPQAATPSAATTQTRAQLSSSTPPRARAATASMFYGEVQSRLSLDGLHLEEFEKSFRFVGKTYDHREKIKELGGKFYRKEKFWYFTNKARLDDAKHMLEDPHGSHVKLSISDASQQAQIVDSNENTPLEDSNANLSPTSADKPQPDVEHKQHNPFPIDFDELDKKIS